MVVLERWRMSVDEWVGIIARSGHDLNHYIEPQDCAECVALMEEYGPMPVHEDLLSAIFYANAKPAQSKYCKVKIPDALRWEVWERDNFTCQECGTRRFLAVDHIEAESKGGTLDLSNLRTLCQRCNSRKGAR